MASPPASQIAATAEFPEAGSISAITTLAPSKPKRSAMPRPMPAPAPVTMATRFFNRICISLTKPLPEAARQHSQISDAGRRPQRSQTHRQGRNAQPDISANRKSEQRADGVDPDAPRAALAQPHKVVAHH